jgi:antitoxin (DNA-binding transcriptional repressor) of toxin-antitoxin stability system
MGKMIGAAEFKAHCLRILDEVERTGEPVTITKRGRVVGELHPPAKPERKGVAFGFLKHPDYRLMPTQRGRHMIDHGMPNWAFWIDPARYPGPRLVR